MFKLTNAILVLFVILCFLFGDEDTKEAGWISFVIAFAALWLTFLFARDALDGIPQKFGGFPQKSNNMYKGIAIHQRNQQQKELNELSQEVEDMNDRFDGFG